MESDSCRAQSALFLRRAELRRRTPRHEGHELQKILALVAVCSAKRAGADDNGMVQLLSVDRFVARLLYQPEYLKAI